MADGNKKFFIHTETGEVIMRRTKLGAYAYFKRDGKKLGYTTNRKQVMTLREFVAKKLIDGLTSAMLEDAEEEDADGIA